MIRLQVMTGSIKSYTVQLLFVIGLSWLMVLPLFARDEKGKLIQPQDRSWLDITSVKGLVKHHPDRVDVLFGGLDLEHPGLERVKTAYEAGKLTEACRALLDYYKTDGRCEWVLEQLPDPKHRHVQVARDVLKRKIHKGNTEGTVPVKNGAWDWNYTGPKDNREYTFSLNRHHFFTDLLLAWKKTGNAKFARAFDRIVRDWILHTVYPGEDHAYVWTWRVLEAGFRMRNWLPAFYGFLSADEFSPAGRLLMLSSLVQHGRYIRMHHWSRHNHALMELDGLNRLGLALPELKKAESWHKYALNEMIDELDHQVYPDGAHDELSSGYHGVSLRSFESIADVCRDAGRSVPEAYRERLEDMYDYWVGLVRPDGSLPQNNRSDRKVITDPILDAAGKYNRPDWRYIVTNGEQGTRPEGFPSCLAPYAGHLVSRSGWGKDAMWSFFDAGPAGAGWVHADALHLSVTAYGKDFLVDSGRFWYERDRWTDFAHSSRSHNVILIDGRGQKPKPKKTGRPIPESQRAVTESMDFTRATHRAFKNLKGDADHTRTVVFLHDPGCWVVLDRVSTNRPRRLTALWHFRPEREVKLTDAGTLVTNDREGANLAITPVGSVQWENTIVRGQESPRLQGWYSEQATEWEPNPCVRMEGQIEGDAVFAWILYPVREGANPARAVRDPSLNVSGQTATIRFSPQVGSALTMDVPLEKGPPSIHGENFNEK